MALDWGNDEGIKNFIRTGEWEMDSQSTVGCQVVRYRDFISPCDVSAAVLLSQPAAREKYYMSTTPHMFFA